MSLTNVNSDWMSNPSSGPGYYTIYTIVRRRIKGATCGLYGMYTCCCDCREYNAESGVYTLTTGSILLSQGCIFWQLVVELVYIAAQLRNLQLQHRGMENLFLQWKDHFPSVLTRRATANAIESPRTVFSTFCTSRAQQPKHLTNFSGYLCSDTVLTWCVEPRMAGRPLLLPDS